MDNFSRRLCSWLVFLFAVGVVRGQTVSAYGKNTYGTTLGSAYVIDVQPYVGHPNERDVTFGYTLVVYMTGTNGPPVVAISGGSSQVATTAGVTGTKTGTITVHVSGTFDGPGGSWRGVMAASCTTPINSQSAYIYDQGFYKFTVKFPPATDRAITYDVYQGANLIDTVTLQPGDSGLIKTYTSTDSTPLTIKGAPWGFNTDDSGFSWGGPPTIKDVVGTPVTPDNPVPSPTRDTTPSGTPTNVPPPPSDGLPGNGGGPIWEPQKTGGGGLTEKTFMQGTEKVVDAIQKSGSSGGSGGPTDFSAVVSKLEQIRMEAQDRFDDERVQEYLDMKQREKEALDANPSAGDMADAGAAAADAIAAVYPSVSQVSHQDYSGTEPDLTIALPAKFGGGVFDLNPFRADRGGPVVDWFRSAMSWMTIALFGLWASRQVAEWSRGVSMLHQAKGNPVVGGTGAQATALIAAGLMTAAVVTFTVALLGWLSGDFSLVNVLSLVTTSPLSTMPGKAAWMLCKLLPVGTMLSAIVARITWNFYAAKIFAFCTAVVRFVVP
ncbi:MAG TPA: hypothetical protein VFT72_04815 [Opitutaceae bacterium]|nr:hypothetical protein [Opitutaceae bacterium]